MSPPVGDTGGLTPRRSFSPVSLTGRVMPLLPPAYPGIRERGRARFTDLLSADFAQAAVLLLLTGAMLRVLQINDYPPAAGGGAEVLLGRTLELLRARDVRADVFTAADLPDARRTPRRYLDNPVARRALAARLEALRPDVVHLHNFYHLLSPGILLELERYKQRRPLRVVMTAHDYHLVCPNSGGNWFAGHDAAQPIDPRRVGSLGYLLSRRWDGRGRAYSLLKLVQHLWAYHWRGATRALDVVICPGRFMQHLVQPLGRPTCHLPPPIPPVAHRAGERPDVLHLTFAGRVGPEKGVAEFLRALPGDFAGQLTVVGDGPELPRCRQVSRQRRLAVRFLGRLPHEGALAEIARAHVLVLPSRCLEGAPLTLVEALAVGTNVLASDLGGMREIIEQAGVGYLFDPTDAASLARQVARITADHAAGVLNRFDVSAFLAARGEESYLRGLLRVYEGRQAA